MWPYSMKGEIITGKTAEGKETDKDNSNSIAFYAKWCRLSIRKKRKN